MNNSTRFWLTLVGLERWFRTDPTLGYHANISQKTAEPGINGAVPPFPSLNSARGTLPPADFGLSPFGMELGEFMMDDDLVAMIDRQGIFSMEPGSAYNP